MFQCLREGVPSPSQEDRGLDCSDIGTGAEGGKALRAWNEDTQSFQEVQERYHASWPLESCESWVDSTRTCEPGEKVIGVISLDGALPSQFGHTALANEIIRHLNETYDYRISGIDEVSAFQLDELNQDPIDIRALIERGDFDIRSVAGLIGFGLENPTPHEDRILSFGTFLDCSTSGGEGGVIQCPPEHGPLPISGP